MTDLRLALRNVLRNRRRTVATVLAVALSCAGLILFGGYVMWARYAGEAHAVTMSGHLQLFQKGYLEKGAANPAAYAMKNFEEIRRSILEDPEIGPRIEFITAQLLVLGMISHAEKQANATFLGLGVFPDDFERLLRWNPYGVCDVRELAANRDFFSGGPELDARDPDGLTLGLGLARMLDISKSSDAASAASDGKGGDPRPEVELLSLPPSGGIPNVLSLFVRKVTVRPMQALDDRLVMLPIQQASELLFPGEPVRVTSVIVVVRRFEDLALAKTRISGLAARHGFALEMRDCWELQPDHVRSLNMMNMFFIFAFCIIAVVLTFTIYNTMMMAVMERTAEIGTLRSMGMTQRGILGLFAAEGLLLGVIGGVLGLLLGITGAWVINSAEILYQPPFVPFYAKMEIFALSAPWMMLSSVAVCVVVVTIAALPPARHASRLNIAEAMHR